MRLERGDYAVIDVDGKNKFIKVLEVGKQNVGVIADKTIATRETEQRIPFNRDQLLANLGDDPRPGTAYGQKLEPWRRSEEIAPWGVLHYFRTVPDRDHRKFIRALRGVGARITEMGLHHTLPIELHVRPKQGKTAGMYSHRPGDDMDIMTFHPEHMGEDTEYVVWHEDAHRVWFTLLDQEIRARWIRLYLESVQLDNYPMSEIEEMGRSWLDSRSQIAAFRKDLGDTEERDLFDDCIGWITGWHSVSKHNLDVLMSDDPASAYELWPDQEIMRVDKDLVISEYGKKNPEEYFAECWSFHYSGKQVPGRITNAVERTYESIGV